MRLSEVKLGDFLELKRGYDLPKRERKIGKVPVVSSSGFTGYHNEHKVEGPGVVTGRYGTLGEVFYVTEKFWPLNTSLYVTDFKGNHERYCAYLLEALLKNISSNKSSIPGVNRNVLHTLPVKVYSDISLQVELVSKLSRYDELIQNNKRRIQLLEKSARLLYKEWFVHLRFPGHEHTKITDGVPMGWEKLKIGNVFDTTSGGTPSRKNPEYFTGDINWAKTQELNEGYLFDTEEKITEQAINNSSAKLFPSETLLVSIYGGTNIGRSTILANPSASNQACVALWSNHPAVSNYYGQLFFQVNRSYLIGLAQGAAQTNISQKVLQSIEILVPTELLHEYFLSIIEPIYGQIKSLQQSLNHLKKARDLLLPKLMNGDIQV